jgi:hypothetical protein
MKARPCQIGSGEARLVKSGLSKVGTSKIGPSKIGSGEVGEIEAGPLEVGLAAISAVEISLVQISVFETGIAEVGIAEAGLTEFRPSEVGVTEVGLRKVSSEEDGPGEVYLGAWPPLPVRVPSFGVHRKDDQLTFLGHDETIPNQGQLLLRRTAARDARGPVWRYLRLDLCKN